MLYSHELRTQPDTSCSKVERELNKHSVVSDLGLHCLPVTRLRSPVFNGLKHKLQTVAKILFQVFALTEENNTHQFCHLRNQHQHIKFTSVMPFYCCYFSTKTILIFSTLGINSADKLIIFFLFYPESRD